MRAFFALRHRLSHEFWGVLPPHLFLERSNAELAAGQLDNKYEVVEVVVVPKAEWTALNEKGKS